MMKVEGRNPVLEALKTSRPSKVLISDKLRDDPVIQRIVEQARSRRTPVEFVKVSQLNKTSETKRHQGVIALVEVSQYNSVSKVLPREGDFCVVMLDHVQDPMNLGSILRTSEAAGVSVVVVPKKGGVGLTPSALRASMGAGLRVPVVRTNLYQAIKLLGEEGSRIVAVDASGDVDYYDERLTGSLTLVLGSEGRGMSPTLLEKCDSVVRIPMLGETEFLNVGVAAAVVLYERVRQRRQLE